MNSVQETSPAVTTVNLLSASDYDLPLNIESVLARRGVPQDFLKYMMTEKQKEAFDDSIGYYLHGTVGTRKTGTAVTMMREIMIRNSRPYKIDTMVRGIYDAWFFPVTTILGRIKSSFRPEAAETEADVIDRVSSPALIVLDDLGTEKVTEWTLQTLYTIIDIRSRNNRQTIITSNLGLEQLGNHLSDRISSRIRGMCKVVLMTGKDRR